MNARTQPTNADMLVGKECLVKETIRNLQGTGAVSVDGKVWTARTEDDSIVMEEKTLARVVRIEGVKLIVKPISTKETEEV